MKRQHDVAELMRFYDNQLKNGDSNEQRLIDTMCHAEYKSNRQAAGKVYWKMRVK